MYSKLVHGVLALLIMSAGQAHGFKESDFKKCSQVGFCRRGQAIAARASLAGKTWKSPYSIVGPVTVNKNGEAALTAAVKSSLYPEINFSLDVRVHDDGVVRVRMDEVAGLRKRYDEVPSWALVSEPIVSKNVKWNEGKKDVRATFGDNRDFEVVVEYEPLKVKLLRGGKEQVVLNGRGLLHMEHFRTKRVEEVKTDAVEGDAQAVVQTPPANLGAWFEGETEDDCWEETFNSWTDTKPKGAYSLSPVSSGSNTSVQVLNLFLSISHSPTTGRYTVYLNTLLVLLYPLPPATILHSASHTGSTTTMYSNTHPHPPTYHLMAPFQLCMLNPRTLRLDFFTALGPRLGSMFLTLLSMPQRRIGYPNPASLIYF
jgi:hypothetical protein